MKPAVAEAVYRCLLEGWVFNGTYQPRQDGGRTERQHRVNPLGLVFRNSTTYLVCTLGNNDKPVHLPLHRFHSAQPLQGEPRFVPDNFSLDAYIAAQHFDYPRSAGPREITLKARFSVFAIHNLRETPLSGDQTIAEETDHTWLLTATVANTYQLRWWLREFGDQVEILEPLELREEFSQLARNLSRIYETGDFDWQFRASTLGITHPCCY